MKTSTLIAAVTLLAGLIVGSTVFFRYVEGWGWVDSYFFTVVTLSTVGYGNLVPETDLGKIATTGLIFIGIGAFALALQQFGAYMVRRQEEHKGWIYRHLHPDETEGDQRGAKPKDDTP